MRGLWDKAVALEPCGQRLNGKNLLLVAAYQARAQMLGVFGIMQVPDLFDEGTCRRERRNAEFFPDQVDPMIVVPDGIDTSSSSASRVRRCRTSSSR